MLPGTCTQSLVFPFPRRRSDHTRCGGGLGGTKHRRSPSRGRGDAVSYSAPSSSTCRHSSPSPGTPRLRPPSRAMRVGSACSLVLLTASRLLTHHSRAHCGVGRRWTVRHCLHFLQTAGGLRLAATAAWGGLLLAFFSATGLVPRPTGAPLLPAH